MGEGVWARGEEEEGVDKKEKVWQSGYGSVISSPHQSVGVNQIEIVSGYNY